MPEPTPTPTDLLLAWGQGDVGAFDQLAPLVCSELRRLTKRYMGRERPGHTLQATALVNEACISLLVDSARARGNDKRGGGVRRVKRDWRVASAAVARRSSVGAWGRTKSSHPEPSRRWQISTDGGEDPAWAGDGRELFYRSGDRVMSVAVAGGSTFKASTPRVLFAGDYARGGPPIDFDVHPDGQRFLMLQPSRPEPQVTHINVVLNWFEELKRRLPATQ